MDAQVSQQPPSYDGISTVSVAEVDPEILSQGAKRNDTGAKSLSLAVAIGLNALVL